MLPDQALLDVKINSTPAEFGFKLRSQGSCFWWQRGKFFIVTDYRLAEVVMKSPDYTADRTSFFISRMPNLDLRLIKDFFGVIAKMMVMSDAPEHTVRRKIAGLGISDEGMDYFQPVIEKTVKKLLDKVNGDRLEFVSEIAEPLPSIVLADLFCIDEKDRKNFYRWSNNMTQFFGGASQYRNEDGVEVNQSASHIRDYFVELVEQRRKAPADDFLSILLRYQSQFGLQDNEIISQAIMMLVAGQITTTDQICNNLFTLLTEDDSEIYSGNDNDLSAKLEECNRWDPAVSFLFRVANKETRLGEQVIPEGGVVFISTHAVNRDPAFFASPERFIADRKPNPHFAYGHGPHFCLGARLARIQMVTLFRELFLRFPALSFAEHEAPRRKHHSLAFSGFERISLQLNAKERSDRYESHPLRREPNLASPT